jgi:hypothetical protein
LEVVAEVRAEGGEGFGILCEGDGGIDVGGEVRGGELGEAGVAEEGDALAGGPAVAIETEDGDALPEGFHGGGAAIVGEGVEGEVDIGVGGEEVVVGGAAGAGEAVRGDAVGFEGVEKVLADGGAMEEAVFEDQAGVGGAAEDFGPGGDYRGVELVVGGEAAEGEVTVCEEGRGGDGGDFVLDLEGEIGAGDAEDGFRIVGFLGGMDDVGVADEVVVGGDAGGGVEIEPAGDEGGGFAGDEGEAVDLAVAVEVDEEVELELGDAMGGFFVREGGDVEEVVGGVLLVAGAGGAGAIGEEEELEAGTVVMVEEAPDGFHPVIGLEERGEIADAERAGVGSGWRRGGGG